MVESPDTAKLVAVAIGGIGILLYLIIRQKLHAFVALLLVSVLIGLGAGMSPAGDYIWIRADATTDYGLEKGKRLPCSIIQTYDAKETATDPATGQNKTIHVPKITIKVGKNFHTLNQADVQEKAYSIIGSMTSGMGSTLGFVAVVVGLGAMFGQLLEVSGGAQVLARGMLDRFSMEKSPWALGLAGFMISVPVFFDVGFVILAPILYGLHKRSGKPLMYFAAPLMGGMVVTHAFIPPTPGPIGVANILGAKLGHVILFGAIAGIPAMIAAGPLFNRFIHTRVPGRIPEAFAGKVEKETDMSRFPSFKLILFLIFFPIALILAKTTTDAIMTEKYLAAFGDGNWRFHFRNVLTLLGDPFIALLITAMLCFKVLGTARGLTREQVSDIANKSLEPAGIIILVTGAGGVLKQVLINSDVGKVIADQLMGLGASVIVLAFLIAAVVRVMQGSATVAMLTAAGLVKPILDAMPTPPSEAFLALLVIPIAAGATFLGHVNDSGFWLVNRYLGLTVPETLKSFSVMTVIIGLMGLIMSLIMSLFIT